MLILEHVRQLVRDRDAVLDVERRSPDDDLLRRRVVEGERVGRLARVEPLQQVDLAADEPERAEHRLLALRSRRDRRHVGCRRRRAASRNRSARGTGSGPGARSRDRADARPRPRSARRCGSQLLREPRPGRARGHEHRAAPRRASTRGERRPRPTAGRTGRARSRGPARASAYIRSHRRRTRRFLRRRRHRPRLARRPALGSMPPCSTPSTPPAPGTPGTLLRELRDEGPLATVAGDLRYVTRYAEARGVLRDTETFSNASGMKAPGVDIPFEDRLLGELDPPRHTAVRRVMVTAMTPKVVHAAEPFIAATAAALLDALPPDRLRSRRVVHGRPAEPRHHVPARLRPRRRRPARALGEGADGEHVPRAQPHRARRRVSRPRSPSSRATSTRASPSGSAQLAAGEDRDDVLARLIRLEVDDEPLPPATAPRARPQPDHRRTHHHESAARQPAVRDRLPARARDRGARRSRRC